MRTKVMIIGAGPVGMTLAAELARYGIKPRIVDKAARRTDKSKALVLWSRTLELLDRGIGSAPFRAAGFTVDAVNFATGHKRIGRLALGSADTLYPYAMMLPQSETERLLEERLAELGVVVERNVEVTQVAPGAEGARLVLKHADGSSEDVEADWLAGCDGAHSIARHALGASFQGQTNPSDWVLADVKISGYPAPDNEMSIYWHQEGAFVIFPITPGRYRVVMDLPGSGAAVAPTPTLAEVQALMDRRGPGGMVASDPFWLSGFRINERKVSRYRFGRVFLAGDAAHVHSPAGGQGMNTGMQDAFNLGWKLAAVLQGAAGEALLDSYSQERNQVGEHVLKMAGRMTMAGTLRHPWAQRLRNGVAGFMLKRAQVQHFMAALMTEITIGYPDSPLNGPGLPAGPKPGRRLRPVAGQTPPGSGERPLFALYGAGDGLQGLVERFPALVAAEIRSPLQDGIWLVRPDGYVACAAKTAGEIEAYLRGL